MPGRRAAAARGAGGRNKANSGVRKQQQNGQEPSLGLVDWLQRATAIVVIIAAAWWFFFRTCLSDAERAFEKMEAEVRELEPNDTQAALDCSLTAVLLGRLTAATEWNVEALRRLLRATYPGDVGVAFARSISRSRIFQLFSVAEEFGIQLVRTLRRARTPVSIVQELRSACGPSEALERLAEASGYFFREDVALVIAQCAIYRDSIGDLIRSGGRWNYTSIVGQTTMHMLAHFGDAEWLRAALQVFPPEEVNRQVAQSDEAGITPHSIAVARGHKDVADLLVTLSPEAAAAVPPGLGCGVGGPGCPPPKRVRRRAAEEDLDNGGWRGSGEMLGGELRQDWCELFPMDEPVSVEGFRKLALLRDRPVIIRGGEKTWRLGQLRRLLRRQHLLNEHGAVQGHSSTTPPEAGGPQHKTQQLRKFVQAASQTYHAFSEPQGYFVVYSDSLGMILEDSIPEWLLNATAPDWRVSGPRSEDIGATTYLGPPGSGIPPHYHEALFTTLVYGLKRWWFIPPKQAAYSRGSALQWATGGAKDWAASGRTVFECLQRPGDAIYVPDYWGHASINLEHSVSVSIHLSSWRRRFQTRIEPQDLEGLQTE